MVKLWQIHPFIKVSGFMVVCEELNGTKFSDFVENLVATLFSLSVQLNGPSMGIMKEVYFRIRDSKTFFTSI